MKSATLFALINAKGGGGGGTDVSDTTAVAEDVASGKYFYTAQGVKTEGTHVDGDVSQPLKDVNFFDYDGTILYSYTAQEFANLTALPTNPTHPRLTAQGWNWTLSDAKTYVATYKKLNIGQMYVTTSGATELDIEMNYEFRRSPILNIYVDGTVTVDWGDNTTPDTVTGSDLLMQQVQHTYTNKGNYIISISSINNSTYSLSGSSQILYADLENLPYYYQDTIKHIRIGNNFVFREYSFAYLYKAEDITIPAEIQSFSIESLAENEIKYYTIPINITEISQTLFNFSYSSYISFPNGITRIEENAMSGSSLRGITLPSSLTYIGRGAFIYCNRLETINIPSGVTEIETEAFKGCSGLKEIHLFPTTPPTLGTYAFDEMQSDCVIYVPYSSDHSILTAYRTLWAAYADYIQEEPQ